ncbi:MAG: hypothetical protein SAJ72_01935 [Jaaginema sp. PMC 1080.18]|nr:hypothetical protein [Jaaginema sp. PMC 1080.18]MEC4865494.1 hypothetical protein [Jaaginema sp. PMC 1078.18]
MMLLEPEVPPTAASLTTTPASETIVASDYYNRNGRCRRCARGSGRREILAISADIPQVPGVVPDEISEGVTPNSLSWY